jgi:hypothetical protein
MGMKNVFGRDPADMTDDQILIIKDTLLSSRPTVFDTYAKTRFPSLEGASETMGQIEWANVYIYY